MSSTVIECLLPYFFSIYPLLFGLFNCWDDDLCYPFSYGFSFLSSFLCAYPAQGFSVACCYYYYSSSSSPVDKQQTTKVSSFLSLFLFHRVCRAKKTETTMSWWWWWWWRFEDWLLFCCKHTVSLLRLFLLIDALPCVCVWGCLMHSCVFFPIFAALLFLYDRHRQNTKEEKMSWKSFFFLFLFLAICILFSFFSVQFVYHNIHK